MAERLRARFPGLEARMLARAQAISDPAEATDPAYIEGLRASLPVALEYALTSLEVGEERTPEVPPALRAQARMAARAGVPVDTVLRRYAAGYALIVDTVLEETAAVAVAVELRNLMQGHSAVFDRLLSAIAEEHRKEMAGRLASVEARRAARVRRLLAGEAIDTTHLNYSLDGWHIGLVATGPSADQMSRRLAGWSEKRLLLVRLDELTTWAWLGGRQPAGRDEVAELIEMARRIAPPGAALAVGEPADGSFGWRLTHRQAQAILPLVEGQPTPVGRYRDSGLLASIRSDELLATSLRRFCLEPLESDFDVRETLRAYFAAGRNVSSAGSLLGVKRHTVTKRVRIAEEKLGFSVADFSVELEAAFRLEEVEHALGHSN